MPWKEHLVSDERLRFVLACLDEEGDSMAALCRRFGISRRVGYKWLARYKEHAAAGMAEFSRAPRSHPNQVAAAVERRVLALRADHPTWGPRKLLAALARRDAAAGVAATDWPAASTVGQMLRRAGLVVPRRPRRRDRSAWAPPTSAAAAALAGGEGPNRLWCADFKGWFRTGDGSRCDPLTVTDAFSRYLLRCRLVDRLSFTAARALFEAAFREYGLPDAIRTDNGSPFATTGPLGLSRLSVWWLRLGVAHDRIEPGHPEQNGRHERMHQTLKREAASPPAATPRAQQARFDRWVPVYNHERPHEGLPGMATPASLYRPGARAYPGRLPEVAYPAGHAPRWVDDSGKFRWAGVKVFLSHALAEQTVGLAPLPPLPAAADHDPNDDLNDDDAAERRYWRVRFASLDLGVLDAARGRLLTPRERRHLPS
jgi:transposase InsO family protein